MGRGSGDQTDQRGYFLKLSAGIRSIRADPRSIPRWALKQHLNQESGTLW